MIGSLPPRYLQWFLRALPNFLWPLKVMLIRSSVSSIGHAVRIGPNSTLIDHRKVTIGDNVFIGDGLYLSTEVPVRIGNNVMFGPKVMMIAGDHNFAAVGLPMIEVKDGGHDLPITIEDDVWIGARCLILKGVVIGEGAVIGAGALVTRSILPYSLAVGTPARAQRCRFDREQLIDHLKRVNSRYSFDAIEDLYKEQNIAIEGSVRARKPTRLRKKSAKQ